LQIKIFRLQS